MFLSQPVSLVVVDIDSLKSAGNSLGLKKKK